MFTIWKYMYILNHRFIYRLTYFKVLETKSWNLVCRHSISRATHFFLAKPKLFDTLKISQNYYFQYIRNKKDFLVYEFILEICKLAIISISNKLFSLAVSCGSTLTYLICSRSQLLGLRQLKQCHKLVSVWLLKLPCSKLQHFSSKNSSEI